MARNLRGAYMNFEHDRAQDWDFLAKWQPNVVRYMGNGDASNPDSFDVNRVNRIHDTCPDATILLRCWGVDDNNFAAHNAMVADPKGTANRQVEWWASVLDRCSGIPREQLMAGLNNETGPEKDDALYTYTERALVRGTELDVRLGVFVFSVGRPALDGEAHWDITRFSSLEPFIRTNKGAVILHEYMQPEGMYAVWTDDQGNERKDYTYLIGRNLRWPLPLDIPIIIGEWGIDGILWNRHADPVYGNSGWRNFQKDWPPSRYADEYVECVRVASNNVIGICPFISDFSDHKWQSFDMLDAYGELLARKDLCVKQASAPPVTTHLPSVVGSKPAYVIAPSGANVRSAPVDGAVLTAVPFGAQVQVIGVDSLRPDWSQVRVGGAQGWIRSDLLGNKPAETKPAPKPPTGDNWQRSYPHVLKIEGGLSLDPNDPGNWYNGELVGTNHGISGAVWGGQYDIKSLTKEQALEIYRKHYWEASGSDRLPWPQCLIVFDTAVNHGVGVATELLSHEPTFAEIYLGLRALRYFDDPKWANYGIAWGRRVNNLHEIAEASKT